jgi:signal transduction histidine kinase
MRSDEPARPRTLAGRLTWTLALSSTLAAVLATVTAMLLGDALIRANVERSVRGAALILEVEIDEAPQLLPEIEAEALELGIDARVAVQRDGRIVAGDPGLRVALAGEDCRIGGIELDDELICVRALHIDPSAWVVVAVPAERLRAHRVALGFAAAGVLVVVLIGSVAAGSVLSRRFLLPLDRLRGAVANVDATAPAAIELPAATGLLELDTLRDAMASLLDRLDAELQRARQFAANAAHELRTPLTKMLAELELAREAAATDDPAGETFARLERTTARLATLTERLLMLATPHEQLATDRGTSISQLVEALPHERPTAAARLVIETGRDDALVRGDELLLAAMLDNAVDNALEYSAGTVRVSVAVPGDEVVIDVEDDGPGVPEAFALEAFTPFRRGQHTREESGHGLGLALVAHVVRAHGGRVAFVQGRARGARLQIRLPAHRARAGESDRIPRA